MRKLVVMLIFAFAVACGSSQSKVAYPWESLPDDQRTNYENNLQCPEITSLVHDVLSNWEVVIDGSDSPEQGTYTKTFMGPEDQIAIVLYTEGANIPFAGLYTKGETSFYFGDFFILNSPGTETSRWGAATGEYFCVLDI
jgi:hypothetical protein